MGSIAREKTGDYKILDEGTHLAICDAVVDVGLQSTPWDSHQENVWVRFEVPAERVSYIRDGLEVDEPMTIWTRYNKTISKKATLRKDLVAWRGREFTPEELAGFDLFNIAGKACLITVVHNESGDKTYANISGIAQIMRGQEVPAQELDTVLFSPEDTDAYDDLPEWLQEKFEERIEIEPEEPAANEEMVDDDVPFNPEVT